MLRASLSLLGSFVRFHQIWIKQCYIHACRDLKKLLLSLSLLEPHLFQAQVSTVLVGANFSIIFTRAWIMDHGPSITLLQTERDCLRKQQEINMTFDLQLTITTGQ
jgi:hypothetical protein